jgi:hypothetical protein
MMNEKNKTFPDNIDWDDLLDDLRNRALVPFLGAGASLGQNEGSGLPTERGRNIFENLRGYGLLRAPLHLQTSLPPTLYSII